MKKKNKKSINEIIVPLTNAVQQDNYDKVLYDRLKPSQIGLTDGEEKLKKYYPPITDLNKDVYASLYKYNPVYNEPQMMASTHKLNYLIMNSLSEAKNYEILRENTKLDPVLSMMGVTNLQEEVKKIIEEKKEEVEKLQEELVQAEQALQDASDMQQMEESGDESDEQGGLSSSSQKPELTLAEAKKRLEEAEKSMQDFAAETFKRSKVNNIVNNVNKEVGEISDAISNWGLDQTHEYKYSGYEEKLKLLDKIKNSHKLKKIAEFLGRLKMLKFREGRDKVKKGFQDIADITQSDKIEKMLVSEYNNLLDPDLQLLFLQNFVNKKLLTYKFKGKNKNQVGAIIVAIDSSGSMSGNREIWAKGVALGALEIARSQKRDLFVIHFSDSRDPKTLHINDFSKANHHSINEILDLANYFEGGGTAYEPVLNRAKQKISETSTFSKADILFISDGECAVTDKWLKNFIDWKVKNNISIVSILMDFYGHSTTLSLNEFSDKVYILSDIMSDSGIEQAYDILSGL